MPRLIALLFFATTLFAPNTKAWAADFEIGNLVIVQPWARAIQGVSTAAVYLTIENRGNTGDTLLAIQTPAAQRAATHIENAAKDNAMPMMGMADEQMESMAQMGTVDIPASSSVHFMPGLSHIMLMGLNQPLTPGQTFPMTLYFKHAGEIEIAVTAIGAGDPAPAP